MSEIIERGNDSLHAYVPHRLAVKSSHPHDWSVRFVGTKVWLFSVMTKFLSRKVMNSGCGKHIVGGKNMCQQFFCLMTVTDLSLTEGRTCLRNDNSRETI